MVIPTRSFWRSLVVSNCCSSCCSYAADMPAMAAAELLRIVFRSSLVPAMSTTEYIRVMSVSPTRGPVSPEATVLAMSLGNPMGRVRITAEAKLVPPLPPALMIPWIGLSLRSSSMHRVVQLIMNLIASPRGRSCNVLLPSFGPNLVTSSFCETVMAVCSTEVRPQSIKVMDVSGWASDSSREWR